MTIGNLAQETQKKQPARSNWWFSPELPKSCRTSHLPKEKWSWVWDFLGKARNLREWSIKYGESDRQAQNGLKIFFFIFSKKWPHNFGTLNWSISESGVGPILAAEAAFCSPKCARLNAASAAQIGWVYHHRNDHEKQAKMAFVGIPLVENDFLKNGW